MISSPRLASPRLASPRLAEAVIAGLVLLGWVLGSAKVARADDQLIGIYPCWGRLESGQSWTVVVDTTSFDDCDWDSANHQRAIQGAIERVIHRWMVSTGADVTVRFGGFQARGLPTPSCSGASCQGNVQAHEVVVVCYNSAFAGWDGSSVLAKHEGYAYSSQGRNCYESEYQQELNRSVISFYKKRVGGQNENLPWIFRNSGYAEEYDFQAVFMHEFGHALGLAHSCDPSGLESELTEPNPTAYCDSLSANELIVAKRQTMYPSATLGWPYNRSGPHTPDIARVKATYGGASAMRTDLKLYRSQSSNGTNWSAPTVVQGSDAVRHTPSLAYNWTSSYGHEVYHANIDINGNPFWRWSANGTSFNNGPSLSSMPASDHPPVILAAGTELVVAAVDRTFDHTAGAGRKVQVRYSSNTGNSWTARTPFFADSAYRPDGAVTTLSDGTQIWMVVWQDAGNYQGKIALSKDDGVNWFVWTLFPMSDAPGVACTAANVCQIAYRDPGTGGTGEVDFTRFLARKFSLSLVAGVPVVSLDTGGFVALEGQNSHRSGMAPRILVQSVSGTASFDYHANYGYATSFAWNARAWRKSVANAAHPHTYSYVYPTVSAPHDILIAKQATLAGTTSILGFFTAP